MWPKIGAIETYNIFYSAGIVVQIVLSWWFCRRMKLPLRMCAVVGLAYGFGMVVGACLLYDVTHGQLDIRMYLGISRYVQGGMWGGLLAYLTLAVPAAYLLGRDKRAALDLVVLPLPIPLMLAKLGCFVNGCCHGSVTHLPWAVTFPEGPAVPSGVPLHPTQLYEILVLAMVACAFAFLDRQRWKGSMLLWFLVLYGAGRALTEVYRGDTQTMMPSGPLSLSQFVCVVVALLGIVALIVFQSWFAPKKPLDEQTP